MAPRARRRPPGSPRRACPCTLWGGPRRAADGATRWALIDWFWILAHALWATGLALILAAAGWADYARRARGLPLRAAWRRLVAGGWSRAGALLACAGMALAGGAWYERALCGGLAIDVGYRWWRGRCATPAAAASPTAKAGTRPAWPIRAARMVAERIVRAEPVLLLLSAPLFLFPSRPLAPALLLLPALALARRVARGHFLPPTPLDWPLGLLALMVLVSAYATPDLSFSLGKIAGLLYGLAAFSAAAGWIDTRRRPGGCGPGRDALGIQATRARRACPAAAAAARPTAVRGGGLPVQPGRRRAPLGRAGPARARRLGLDHRRARVRAAVGPAPRDARPAGRARGRLRALGPLGPPRGSARARGDRPGQDRRGTLAGRRPRRRRGEPGLAGQPAGDLVARSTRCRISPTPGWG